MKSLKRVFWLILAGMLFGIVSVSPVSAHAELIRSDPASNTVLDQSPHQIELLFSEALESRLSTIKVYDSTGAVINIAEAVVNPSNPEQMTLPLPVLPDDVYTVSWQVISQIDGHQTAGSYPFIVGQAGAASLPSAQQNTKTTIPLVALAAKWLLLASAAILAGQYPSVYFVWKLAPQSNDDDLGLSQRLMSSWDVLYRLGLYGLIISFTLGVLAQAGLASGHEIAMPWAKETIQVLIGTRLGGIWLIRLAIALISLGMLQIHAAWNQMARFIISLGLLLTISLTSHSATELHPLLPILGDWLHLIGMAFWLGGLAYLISGLRVMKKLSLRLSTSITTAMARRFSLMALPSVTLIGLTGIYSAFLRVGSIAALFNTIYGAALLYKQGFVAVLIIIAAINLLVISPGLKRDSQLKISESISFQRFGKTVLIEVVLASLLLINVSLMTYLPPAMTPLPKTTLNGSIINNDVNVSLTVTPGLVGQNAITVKLSPKPSLQGVKVVLVSFIPVVANIPPSFVQLTDQGNGVYSGQGSNISFSGRWLIEVTVQRENQFDAIVTFDFTVPGPAPAK